MGLGDTVKGFFHKVDVGEASFKAGIDWLVAAGFFGTQLEGIPESDEEIISQSAKFSKALIPFMGTRRDSWMHELLDRFLQNYEMYLHYKLIRDKVLESSPNQPIKNNDPVTPRTLRISYTVNVLKDMLVSEAKIILSLTYGAIDNKTIVLNKGFILDSGARTGVIPGANQNPQLPPPLKGYTGRIPE